ncbi:hypothetical protein [Asanoa siamensis]|uniref:WD40 repeat protein n=1 Tax=Asanoa siamensis TaxID=926357 RepID=A0ABQ4CSP5_9ACTN|nr:hypothetical protein [Asanoa siamensis]GIF74283.1 hypothetical protein Asi02nite_38010 [Asanoa siamensis]
MTDRLAGALRETFERLADDGGPPPELAGAALTKARRSRRARIGAGLALACVALAGVALGGAGQRGSQVAAGPGGTAILTYSDIDDPKIDDPGPGDSYSLLLDRETGTYRRIDVRSAVPSPDGDRVLVSDGDDSFGKPARVGVLDRDSGATRWVAAGQVAGFPGTTADGRWTPDGRRILFHLQPKAGPPGVVVVDAETLRAQFLPLPDLAGGEGPVPTADSTGFAMLLAGEGATEVPNGIRFYGLDGTLRRTLPLPDGRLWDTPVLSPGGRLALARPMFEPGPMHVVVVDPETGEVRARVAMSRNGVFVGWADEDHLVLRTSDPRTESDEYWVVDLRGAVTRVIDPLEGIYPQRVYLGPSTGLPESANDLTF